MKRVRTSRLARFSAQNDKIGTVPQISVTKVKGMLHFASRDERIDQIVDIEAVAKPQPLTR